MQEIAPVDHAVCGLMLVRQVQAVGRRHQAIQPVACLAQHHEQRPLPDVGQIERRLENELAERGVAGRAVPHRIFGADIEQVPAGVAEGEDVLPFREHADLVRRRQDDADVPVARRRARVRLVGRRDRRGQRAGHVSAGVPLIDFDDVEHLALAAHEKRGVEPVRQAVEALHRRQALRVVEHRLHAARAARGIGRRIEQQHA